MSTKPQSQWPEHRRQRKNRRAQLRRNPWLRHRKDSCERCGFVAKHECQLDVDHIDGNKKNNDPSNYMTLCANCHRLKTQLHRDWDKGAKRQLVALQNAWAQGKLFN